MLNIVSTKETVEGVEGQHGLAKGGGGGDAAGGGERSTLDVRRQRSDCAKSILPHDLFTWEVRSIAAKAKSRKRARDDAKVKEDFTYGQLRRREGDGDTETVDTIL